MGQVLALCEQLLLPGVLNQGFCVASLQQAHPLTSLHQLSNRIAPALPIICGQLHTGELWGLSGTARGPAHDTHIRQGEGIC